MRVLPLALVMVTVLALAGCSSGRLTDRLTSPGSAAHDLVSAKSYPKLLLEVDSPPGYGPDASALQTLRSTLADVTGRDASNVLVDDSDTSIPSEPSKRYSQSEIQSLENSHRSRHTAGDTVVLYLLYVAGGSDADSSDGKSLVLGAAYHGTSIVMFKGNIQSASGGLTKPPLTVIERAVLVHETGHTMGLVNLGAPMVTPHEDTAGGPNDDPARRGHSTNQQSVMYWAVESTGGLNVLCNIGLTSQCAVPYEFDANDKADLGALARS